MHGWVLTVAIIAKRTNDLERHWPPITKMKEELLEMQVVDAAVPHTSVGIGGMGEVAWTWPLPTSIRYHSKA